MRLIGNGLAFHAKSGRQFKNNLRLINEKSGNCCTIGELSNKIGVNAATLDETIRQYNQSCADQQDTQFGRSKKTLLPIGAPPYYAVELGLSIVNTQGGPKRNQLCQVLNHHDKVIPRLYAAGELGSFFGFLYQPGSNYPEAWATGQIAGKAAAAEASLSSFCAADEGRTMALL